MNGMGLRRRGAAPACAVLLWSCVSGDKEATDVPSPDGSVPAVDGGADASREEPHDAGSDGAPNEDAAVTDLPPGPWGRNPFPTTNYDEPYRGQFHFTPPGGHANDVNGLWYWNGVYYMAYQAYAYTLHWGDTAGDGAIKRDMAYATSRDLVHWEHQGLMIEADVSSLGQVWSGSTVVDPTNTSGLGSGLEPVFATVFTCTAGGTCVTYSTDRGITWTPYANNPVSIGAGGWEARDPHVFWHAPTSKWVALHYDAGTVFYTSPDLKSWTKTSSLTFGFECPDFFELPVDGDAQNTRWVLQDGSGAYLIGEFDGATFTPDADFAPETAGGAYRAQKMDQGDSFYAAQSFFRESFPDERVVQVAWMRGPYGVTAPWTHALSFPAELSLVSTESGIRVARRPIAEIATLHGSATERKATTLSAGQNLLAGMQAKAFDLEVKLDVAASTATSITLRIADKTFSYDVSSQTFIGRPLPLRDGKLELRVLADHGQLEVFGAGGLFSYTSAQFFAPRDARVELVADGTLAVESASLRTLKRAWPGTPASSSTIIDNTDAGHTFSGENFIATEERYHGNGCTVVRGAGSSFELSFTGTRVEWYGLKNNDLGKADIYVDGRLEVTGAELFDTRRQNAQLFSRAGLARGPHTLRVVLRADKHPASAGIAMVHDYVIAYDDP
jgi:fructan beta-fructosidase